MTDVGALTFEAVYARGVFQTLVAIVSTSSAGWEVWARASDGRRFMLKDLLDEGGARDLVRAFDGQLRESGSPAGWAESKGFDPLALHLHQIAMGSGD
jgi:hypothetical protein